MAFSSSSNSNKKLGRNCVAIGCSVREGSGISFYRFPANTERRAKWINAVKRLDWQPTPASRICANHFITGKKSDDITHPDYVPSVFTFTKSPTKRKLEKAVTCHGRKVKRTKINMEDCQKESREVKFLLLGRLEPNATRSSSTQTSSHGTYSISTQTIMSGELIELERICHRQSSVKLSDLQARLDNIELSEHSFKDNDNKTLLYTGLKTYLLLKAVLDLCMPSLNSNAALPPFQQLLITLMKLRLDLSMSYLSHIFGISVSTCSRYFNDIINILQIRLVPLTVFWPSRDILKQTLPNCFISTFPKCVSIIDCFEIFIDTPSNMKARAATYSTYKSNNTVKYFISISPHGVVNFISKGWGGRFSDRAIVERSPKFLNSLLPGDVVLADRGFTIQDLLALHNVKLEIPAFTKGRQQLTEKETVDTRNIAAVRIHVERVIGSIRQKFPILNSSIPITFMQSDGNDFSTIDKIVHVACALNNVCDSVVPT